MVFLTMPLVALLKIIGGKFNSTNGPATLALYGTIQTTNWTSGYLEFSASGVLMLA